MSENKPVDAADTMQVIASQGRALLKEGNRRRIIARNPENTILLDVSVTQAVIAALVLVLVLPVMGWLILLAIVGIGISKKIRLDFVREIGEGDDTISVAAGKRKRLSTDDEDYDDENSATTIDDEVVKAKRR